MNDLCTVCGKQFKDGDSAAHCEKCGLATALQNSNGFRRYRCLCGFVMDTESVGYKWPTVWYQHVIIDHDWPKLLTRAEMERM